MSSRILRFLLTIGILGMAVSCGLKVNDEYKTKPKLKVENSEFSCFPKMNSYLDRFFVANIKSDEMNEFMMCIYNGLATFGNYFEGEHRGEYSPGELRQFLERFYVDQDISDEFLHQIMTVKSLMFGGDNNSVSKEEFKKLLSWVDQLRVELIKILPFIKLFNPNVGPSMIKSGSALPDVNAAFFVATSFAKQFAKWLSLTNTSYSINDMEQLIFEFRKFVNRNNDSPEVDRVKEWMEFFNNFKTISVGSVKHKNQEMIGPLQWDALIQSGLNWYKVWMRYEYQLKNNQVLFGQGLRNLDRSLSEATLLLRNSILSQKDKVITHNQFYQLIRSAEKLEFIPGKVRIESVIDLVKPLFNKMFGDPSVKSDKRVGPGLTREVLSRIQSHFDQWLEIQYFIDKQFQSTHPRNKVSIVGGNKFSQEVNIDIAKVFAAHKNKGSHIAEMQDLLEKIRPLFKANDFRVYLLPESEQLKYQIVPGSYNASLINLYRAVAKVIINGYSSNAQLKGIAKAELQTFTNDIKKLAEDYYIVRPNNNEAGELTFNMGNLFTYQANGLHDPADSPNSDTEKVKHLFDFSEGVEFLAYLVSIGRINNEIYEGVNGACKPALRKNTETMDYEIQKDMFGRIKFEESCYVENIRDLFYSNIDNMPHMQKFIGSLKSAEWEKFYGMLKSIAYKPVGIEDHSLIEDAQMSNMVGTLHYVETIITRYDMDEDGRVNEEEAEAAEPVFAGLIKSVLKTSSRKKNPFTKIEVIDPITGKSTLETDWMRDPKTQEIIETEPSDSTVSTGFKFIMSYAQIPKLSNGILPVDSSTFVRIVGRKMFGWNINIDRMAATKIFAIARMASDGRELEDESDSLLKQMTKCVKFQSYDEPYVVPLDGSLVDGRLTYACESPAKDIE